MKKFVNRMAVALFFSLISLCPPSQAEEIPKDLVSKIEPGVVTVYCYDSAGKLHHSGTGFFIEPEGHLITNYHVLGRVTMARIKTSSGNEYAVKSIVGEDPGADLVEAIVDAPESEVRFLALATQAPNKGDPVLMVGSPYGVEKCSSKGIVEGVQQRGGQESDFVYSAHSFHGSSGSPVVNARGEVVGVCRAIIPGRLEMNYAIPVDRISGMSHVQRSLSNTPSTPAPAVAQTEPAAPDIEKKYKQLAEDGRPDAQVALAAMYEEGRGVDKSLCDAYDLYRKAADQDFLPALYHIGRMSCEGKCVQQNFAEAAKWFQKAAERGDANAQCGLGVLYFNGQGVPRDHVQACMWMMLAASRSHSQIALSKLRLFASESTRDEFEQARQLAQQWQPAK